MFDDHDEADAAMKALAQSGFELRRLSVVGKGFHTSETATASTTPATASALGITRRALGQSLEPFMGGLYDGTDGRRRGAARPLPAAGVAAREGAVALGGAGVLVAALTSLGIPEDSVVPTRPDLAADAEVQKIDRDLDRLFEMILRGGAADRLNTKRSKWRRTSWSWPSC